MKIFAVILLAIIAVLGWQTYSGRNGILQYRETEQKLKVASSHTERLQRRNQALEDEISDLKQGNRVVEELARSELGMVKQDETFYRVIEKEDKPSPSK
ncbi:MAG: septum formation initiator family protein [Succinivibrio dextrinosolvens]|uniref:septum formation initiator family protein n=1 Tax=Succinivibrio sp. TaxID=2053619 RepID=UPI0025E475DA|nr:septum formation initiator family protein [Succinivibrio sp.]MDY6416968.1 septum formation initiator family protein [Succinivibrio dextrinosolvens]MBQ9220186.1 septum formation initiator family protein [Succinivibrio sp.]MDY6419286.1 septum formation initiator family protein [Succinivibrio dextrinosolvens]MDY6466717.1 septum formation initiator family protein [Succinivibrio dextrinosolvens]MDY6471111.1 septum formation initiator family protein [Succinivibrio dextrinosolvens]